MSLRLKFVLALVGLVAVATVAIGAFSYGTTRNELLGQLDDSLRASRDDVVAQLQRPGSLDRVFGEDRTGFRSRGDVIVQLVVEDGTVSSAEGPTLPVDAEDRERARSTGVHSWMRDVSSGDDEYRVLTTSLGSGDAVQVARSLEETDEVLAALRRRILVASVVVIALAAVVGAVLARQLTRRLVRLTAAADQVRATGQLDVPVPVEGGDETGRLGAAFSDMLASLARSRDSQQRLVQDAGHELRTPLTSLRTNVYTLRRADDLDPDDRRRVLDDLESESLELTRLVDEVVEVATDRRGDEPEAPVDLGGLVTRVATRAEQRSGRRVEVHLLDAATVIGRPLALERAVGNLVENALKFDASGGPIQVTCEGGRIEVADRGPGIAPADRDHVFDRFYRSDAARSRPGSGLGLSIVADVVGRHGGRTFVADRAGGGAVVGFVLPVG
ncbi:sensor histidine kinase [Dermatobacter hominis]|uniref:sensor histidine kinase n=1 Tax=Dermatobacter hominis TaxID=2884263 RepID=UPI001D10D106|nr:HAMP domain-containing sensor histidine kinase [Dermatobacter hominis]UDY34233.1 HAMP domain-containing histidine kinase [Dermatobacter hominis]